MKVLVLAFAVATSLAAQPDFSGFWSNPYHPGPKGAGPATTFTKEKFPPFKPGGEALFYEPRTGDPRHFQRITRLIPLDGRAHLKDIEPTYYGDSVGHWEGDTLVIDSTNFKRGRLTITTTSTRSSTVCTATRFT
jgi:hypothetical protein